MSKQVYSLVLDDAVVMAVDRAAYLGRTSRSEMINRILSEQLSVITPEMRARRLLSELNRMLSEEGEMLLLSCSDSALTLSSALAYKYRPTVRYLLQPALSGGVGRLVMSMRSRSDSLLAAFEAFCLLFTRLEQSRIGTGIGRYQIEPGRFTREIAYGENLDPERYVQILRSDLMLIDGCLKDYFADPSSAYGRMAERYDAHLAGLRG